MDFKSNQSIYQQIVHHFYQGIVKGDWITDDKIPSVRQLGVQFEVNPNTVMRSYTLLQEQGLIYNRRGLGNFIADGAKEKVAEQLKKDFLQLELPEMFRKMDVLGISMDEVVKYYQSKNVE